MAIDEEIKTKEKQKNKKGGEQLRLTLLCAAQSQQVNIMVRSMYCLWYSW